MGLPGACSSKISASDPLGLLAKEVCSATFPNHTLEVESGIDMIITSEDNCVWNFLEPSKVR